MSTVEKTILFLIFTVRAVKQWILLVHEHCWLVDYPPVKTTHIKVYERWGAVGRGNEYDQNTLSNIL